MTDTEQRYPLSWPAGWPRTPAERRKEGRFTKQGRHHSQFSGRSWPVNRPVTLHQALVRLMAELTRLHADMDTVIVSTNLLVRLDGLPRAGQRAPDDPGVAVYFNLWNGKPRVIPIDTYTKVEQNVAAVAAALQAMRQLDRHGGHILEAAFTGFEALPHMTDDEPWHQVLQVPPDAPSDVVTAAYRRMRAAYHPDRSGDAAQFDRVVKAYRTWEESRG